MSYAAYTVHASMLRLAIDGTHSNVWQRAHVPEGTHCMPARLRLSSIYIYLASPLTSTGMAAALLRAFFLQAGSILRPGHGSR